MTSALIRPLNLAPAPAFLTQLSASLAPFGAQLPGAANVAPRHLAPGARRRRTAPRLAAAPGAPWRGRGALPCVRVLEEQNKKLQDRNAEAGRKIDALLAQLVAASDESTRARLLKELDAARAETARLKKGGKSACTCQPSDPLCSCL